MENSLKQKSINNNENTLKNSSTMENNIENNSIDFDVIFERLIEDKKSKKNKKNEYYCNLLIHFWKTKPLNKMELIQMLYFFNTNNKDKDYKLYLFNEFLYNLNSLRGNELLELNAYHFIEFLLEIGKFYYEEKNYFYSYFHLYNKLYKDISNIRHLRSKIKQEMFELNNQYRNKFEKMNSDELKEILSKLKEIKQNNINTETTKYVFSINNLWIESAINFIENIYHYKGIERENRLNESFSLQKIYENYFHYNINNKEFPYPGPIDNYQISSFIDIWKDPIKEDENFIMKKNILFRKNYSLVYEDDWNILKKLFGATNEIKRLINNLDLILINVILLDKRIIKKNNFNLLKPKYIQTNKNICIREFKEKIIRCANYILNDNEIDNEIDNDQSDNEENFKGIDERNTYDEDIIMTDEKNILNGKNSDNNAEINNINIYKNENNANFNMNKEEIYFYLIEDNKNLLIEIMTAFINEFHIYETLDINEISLQDGEYLEKFYNYLCNTRQVLLIEIKSNNSDSFLSEIKPINIDIYQCSTCKKHESINNRYICKKCNAFFFCSKECCESLVNNDHIKLHECLEIIKLKQFNDSISNYRNTFNLVGLMNLGNTCFINSTLQCLFHTYDLSQYFLKKFYAKDINYHNKQGYNGKIAESFADLLFETETTPYDKINPIQFLKIFFTYNKSLNLRHQQDAQEFLSILLDCLHEDLNRITNKPYFLLEEQKDNENDFDASNRFWDLYKKRENSIIVDLFHGQFKSKIICSSCNKSSITYEPFIFLGLPIPQHQNQKIIQFYFNNKWEYFGFELKNNSNFYDVRKKAVEFMKMCGYGINETNSTLEKMIEFVQIDKNNIIKSIFNDKDLFSIKVDESKEFILYEKKIDKEYFNIYLYPIKRDDYDATSYPISFSVNSELTLKEIIEKNKIKISNLYLNLNENEIQIGILHKKKDSLIYYFSINFNSKEFCPFCQNDEDNYCLLNDNVKIGHIYKKLKFNPTILPLLFVIGNSKKRLKNRAIQIPNYNELYFLNDCLKLFCEEELLSNDNMWYCNKCQKHKQAKKQIRFFKLPNYLIIQLKRFKNTNGFFYSSNDKNDIFIKYPINNLDLSNYMDDRVGNKQKYDLYAVINHHGEISEGHYTSICKINDNWILFNDSRLSKIDNPINKDAYLLFYRRNEQT